MKSSAKRPPSVSAEMPVVERLALRAQVAIDDREADNLDQMQCWVDANGPDSAYEVA